MKAPISWLKDFVDITLPIDELAEKLTFAGLEVEDIEYIGVPADGTCVVRRTGRALYRHWQLADGEAQPVHSLLARAARLVTEITLGRDELCGCCNGGRLLPAACFETTS